MLVRKEACGIIKDLVFWTCSYPIAISHSHRIKSKEKSKEKQQVSPHIFNCRRSNFPKSKDVSTAKKNAAKNKRKSHSGLKKWLFQNALKEPYGILNYTLSWNVLLITSSCCSFESLLKFTAYPDTLIVRVGYFSGSSIAAIKISLVITFTFK